MVTYSGTAVFGGIAIGKIRVYQKNARQVKRIKVDNPAVQLKRFHESKEIAKKQLQGLYDKALHEVGETNAAIFEVHQMMLDDLDYCESVENMIESQGVNAEYAVAITGDNFSQMFAMMDDDYMKERASDVKDISERVICVLNGEGEGQMHSDEACIILADDLAPSETVQLDKDKVLSFVTVHGSSNSHTAILARTMNIPALIGVDIELDENLNGKMAVVEGFEGKMYVDPDEKTLQDIQEKQKEQQKKRQLLQSLKGKENITLDGKKINIYANIGGVSDVASVLSNDAGGIGLFRSEFLYLEKNDYPTEEEQFKVYKAVAENMAGKKVIIRTCDIGADKQVDYFGMAHEENPALGYRAIRICLDRRDMFKTQLRAIFRASAFGNISVMYPMIISVAEIQQIKEIANEVVKELKEDGMEFGEVEQGVMIETPAAVMISDLLAKEVDFFSIGTNDLTQYTLAIDRQNPKLDKIYDSHHLAILRMIQMVVDNAHKEGIWVGICGELGADTTLTKTFLQMEIDELSVSPTFVLGVRDKVRNTIVSE